MSQAQGSAPQQLKLNKGIVKQVLSGDTVVIRGQPKGGPPPEKTLGLTNITAAKLGRRANPSNNVTETKDEPFAWEAREYLRKLLVGQDVQFAVEYQVDSGREYGTVWVSLPGSTEPQNVAELLVSEGFVQVRQNNSKPSEEHQKLVQLEAQAKAANKGRWKTEQGAVREVVWNVENLRNLVERNQGKEMDGIVEYVRDGCSLKVLLVPSFQHISVSLSGIKCPTFKREGGKEVAEPFADVAKFFLESRLLQRDVKILVEGHSNNQSVLATITHPVSNIAELLLKEGLARCVDWSMGVVTSGKDKLRAAEKYAKENQLRIWKDYHPSTQAQSIPIKSKNFSGKVVEVVNADALVIKLADGTFQKIFLSSLRPPRRVEGESADAGQITTTVTGQKARPLYDIPYMFEAREFLRKKLIGKKVNVTVDYIKAAQDGYPERLCCTVMRDDVNIAEALIGKGLATCLRHKQDDEQRSAFYDDLLGAEQRAKKNLKGVHSTKEVPTHKVSDVTGDATKAKGLLPFLQRAGRTVAIVEFVASGSRVRLFLLKDTSIITFLLAGLICPRAPRIQDDQPVEGEPFGQEALMFTKEMIMQREVEVEVEACDKGGNFIGWLYVEGKNLSVDLVAEGLCKVSPQAERSAHYTALYEAESKAKAAKKNIWESYVEKVEEKPEDKAEDNQIEEQAPPEKKYKAVVVTEVSPRAVFWVQLVSQGPHFEQVMEEMRKDLAENPPLAGSFTPKKGQMCVARFTDGLWYRALIEKITSTQEVHVLYVDFGNRQALPASDLAALPSAFAGLPPQAKEYHLACVLPIDDDDWKDEANTAFMEEVAGKTLMLNVEYKVQKEEYASLMNGTLDVAEKLVKEGLLRVEKRREKRLASLVETYRKAEEQARRDRRGIWRYGDITPDDAKEFGYQKGQ